MTFQRSRRRVLVVGRGPAGLAIAATSADGGDVVVGFLDDADDGPDVLGVLDDAREVIRSESIDRVVFAIPSIDAPLLRRFVLGLGEEDIELSIVPRSLGTLVRDSVGIDDLTDVDVLDLVGRAPVKQDLEASRAFLRGKTVLVTGAAGSIGSQLVHHLVALGVTLVVAIDLAETPMFFLEQSLDGRSDVRFVIADVRVDGSLRKVFEQHRPQIVFHAAAFKHVPLMQSNPVEAIINNVGGTNTVLELSGEFGVENVVYVSTDKAVRPVNVMGATKRIGEYLVRETSRRFPTKFNAVRFGNVMESNGSVMQVFRAQLNRRDPLTVTDPRVTRYFMTREEASHLIIQSSFVGGGDETYVLDMGEPVSIHELARSLVRVIDPSLTIREIGLRPGEKLHEELTYEPDAVTPTVNSKILRVDDDIDRDLDEVRAWVDGLLRAAYAHELSNADATRLLREAGFPIL